MSMFGNKFKLEIVDYDKHIVTISPTRGTLAKWTFWSLAPSVLMWGVVAVMYKVGQNDDIDLTNLTTDEEIVRPDDLD